MENQRYSIKSKGIIYILSYGKRQSYIGTDHGKGEELHYLWKGRKTVVHVHVYNYGKGGTALEKVKECNERWINEPSLGKDGTM